MQLCLSKFLFWEEQKNIKNIVQSWIEMWHYRWSIFFYGEQISKPAHLCAILLVKTSVQKEMIFFIPESDCPFTEFRSWYFIARVRLKIRAVYTGNGNWNLRGHCKGWCKLVIYEPLKAIKGKSTWFRALPFHFHLV